MTDFEDSLFRYSDQFTNTPFVNTNRIQQSIDTYKWDAIFEVTITLFEKNYDVQTKNQIDNLIPIFNWYT